MHNITTIYPADMDGNDMDLTPRSTLTVILETATITVISLLILVCNIANIVILRSVTFWHRSTVYLLLNLAVSDICVAIFTTSALIPSITGESGSVQVCQLQAFLGGVSVTVSLITLAYISVDRYVIIAHPLHHHSLMSKKTIVTMMALSWIVSVLLYVWVFWENYLGAQYNPDSYLCSADLTHIAFVTVLVGLIFTPANVVIVFCYGSILCIARKHTSRIQSQQINLAQTDKTVRPKRSHKAAGMFIVIFGLFNLCWAPYISLVIYRIITQDSTTSPHWINFILPWMSMSNSFVNSLIYFALNAQYRRTAMRLLSCNRRYNATEGYTIESQF